MTARPRGANVRLRETTRVLVGLDAPTRAMLADLATRLAIPASSIARHLVVGALASPDLTRAVIASSVAHDLADVATGFRGRHAPARRRAIAARLDRLDATT